MNRIIEVYFFGDEQFYTKCASMNLHDYCARVEQYMNGKIEIQARNKVHVTQLVRALKEHEHKELFTQQIDLHLFLSKIYKYDTILYLSGLHNRVTQLLSWLCLSKLPIDETASAYKKTVLYPGQVEQKMDVYFKDNNKLQNNILNLTQPNNLNATNAEELKEKALENTALLLACKTGDFKAAKHLIQQHQHYVVDVNQQDSKGMTALHWACFYRNENLILALLNAGASINIKNKDNDMPLDLYKEKINDSPYAHNSLRDHIF